LVDDRQVAIMADKPTHEECLELARKLQQATELKLQTERAAGHGENC
jgi:wyosine [tRNA(Phe)-imidazoG37] synthetase (radical SAM superfamily)